MVETSASLLCSSMLGNSSRSGYCRRNGFGRQRRSGILEARWPHRGDACRRGVVRGVSDIGITNRAIVLIRHVLIALAVDSVTRRRGRIVSTRPVCWQRRRAESR